MEKIDIDLLKRNISLLEVASEYGYKLNKTKSTKQSASLKSDCDSIIVKMDKDGHWVYFNTHDSSDKGSVVDFIMYRNLSLTFAQALRQIQAQYFGKVLDAPVEIKKVRLEPTAKDIVGARREISRMTISTANNYLAHRGIKECVLRDRRFYGTVLVDRYRNAVFPHINEKGVCGGEKRNHNFKGFTKGGIKSVWLSNRFKTDRRMLVVEGGIDALSHFALYEPHGTRYLSIGGEPSPESWELIGKIIERFNKQGGEIVSGVDNDKGGDNLDCKLRQTTSAQIGRETPESKDWNKVLKNSLTR